MNYNEIIRQFCLEGVPISCEAHGNGHINSTFKIDTDAGKHYILQKINTGVFRDPEGLMKNMIAVTKHMATCLVEGMVVPEIIETVDGKAYFTTPDNEVWRVMTFVEGGVCLDIARTPEDFYQSAVAFGKFQTMLATFPAETLTETIPNFHNTPDRYRQLKEAIAQDVCGRLKDVGTEVEFALAREADASKLTDLLNAGELPLRVTHNDTKLNNVILNAQTLKPLCIVDLDTVMPGLAAYDYGDSIRFGASTAAEDEKDLDKVHFSKELFAIYTKGYLEACGSTLTPMEIKTLPWGAKLMTLECGSRFLADYLNGDTYFKTDYSEHNLVRARTQFKLVAEMEEQWAEMERIVMNGGEL